VKRRRRRVEEEEEEKKEEEGEEKQPPPPSICCLQETHFASENMCRLRTKRWNKIFHGNKIQKKAEVAISVSDKIDF
jgi:hypothetical protein